MSKWTTVRVSRETAEGLKRLAGTGSVSGYLAKVVEEKTQPKPEEETECL